MESEKNRLQRQRNNISVSIRRQKREEFIGKRRLQNRETIQWQATQQQKKPQRIWQKRTYTMRDFEKLINMIQVNDTQKVLEGLFGLKRLVSNINNNSILEIKKRGLFPQLIKLGAQKASVQVKVQAICCLINITASSDSSDGVSQTIIQEGGANLAFQLVKTQQPNLKLQGAWFLANLCTDQIKIRDLAIHHGVIPIVTRLLLQSKQSSKTDQLIWILSNMCRGHPPPQFQKVKETIPLFCHILNNIDSQKQQMITEVLWALSYISQSSKDANAFILEGNILQKLGEYLRYPIIGVVVPSIRIIGNLFTGNQKEQIATFKPYIYQALFSLVNHDRKPIRRQAIWAISNIAAGPRSFSSLYLGNESLMKRLVQILNTDASQIRKQAAWFFCNIVQINCSVQIATLLNLYKVMDGYVSCIKYVADKVVLKQILQIIDRLLGMGQNLKKAIGCNPFKQLFDNADGKSALEDISGEAQQVLQIVLQIESKYYNTDTSE